MQRVGQDTLSERYGNLFSMYSEITGDNPCEVPMQISPAPHFSMGGLWVDYHLRSNLKGLFVVGEANCADHGANRLGASALMQGLADGYFVLPYTIQNYLADDIRTPRMTGEEKEFVEAEKAAKDRFSNAFATC